MCSIKILNLLCRHVLTGVRVCCLLPSVFLAALADLSRYLCYYRFSNWKSRSNESNSQDSEMSKQTLGYLYGTVKPVLWGLLGVTFGFCFLHALR